MFVLQICLDIRMKHPNPVIAVQQETVSIDR